METQDIEPRIYLQAVRAAKSALTLWCNGQFNRQRGLMDDLQQDLLVWYLETPSTREKMSTLVDAEIFVTFKMRAQQLLSKNQLDDNIQRDRVLYSTESIKKYLKGESTNRYLIEVMPYAMDKINEVHKEALLSRYVDGKIPSQGVNAELLSRAHRTVTAMVNLIQIVNKSEEVVGSRGTLFPESIKAPTRHDDPTGNITTTLMGEHPSYVDEYLDESPWQQVCNGAGACPVINFGPSGRYRLSATEADLFRRVPGLIDLFIDQKQREWKTK